ncbi:MAG: hypothetical protein O7J95_14775 [Planctomycetota bacterium]|nr:hypothetical protein [Planctomycetota bacterium]
MTGKLLSGLERNAGATDVSEERVPQGMKIRVLPVRVHVLQELRFLAPGSFLRVRGSFDPLLAGELQVRAKKKPHHQLVPWHVEEPLCPPQRFEERFQVVCGLVP